MSGPGVPLQRIAQALQAHYGDPAPPPVTDPLGLILWENVAYLVDDQRRMRAFRALEEHTGLDARDIASAPDEVLLKARRELKRFHGIGVPGAEKILLFTGTEAVLALESNGLRVLVRLGHGEEQSNYSGTYRSVQKALADQLPDDCAWLIRTHQLLRQHGKELCKTSRPACTACPLAGLCPYACEGRQGG
jgi:endonuclease III